MHPRMSFGRSLPIHLLPVERKLQNPQIKRASGWSSRFWACLKQLWAKTFCSKRDALRDLAVQRRLLFEKQREFWVENLHWNTNALSTNRQTENLFLKKIPNRNASSMSISSGIPLNQMPNRNGHLECRPGGYHFFFAAQKRWTNRFGFQNLKYPADEQNCLGKTMRIRRETAAMIKLFLLPSSVIRSPYYQPEKERERD